MKIIKNYNLTDSSQNVAWNGTLILLKGRKYHYLNYHSGNSNQIEIYAVVPVNMVQQVINASTEEALDIFWRLKYWSYEN